MPNKHITHTQGPPMKRFFLLTLFLLLGTIHADILNDAANITLIRDTISVSPKDAVILVDDNFTTESPVWKRPFKTFENFTRISMAKTNGFPTLKIERNPDQKPIPKRLFDTAWELNTTQLPLPPKSKRFIISLQVFSNNSLIRIAAGHKESFHNRILWLDANKNTLPNISVFSYDANEKTPALTVIEGEVPRDAAYAILQLGADTPDLLEGEFVAFKSVKLSIITENSKYPEYGQYTSVAFPASEGKVMANADIPEGCAVKWQIATADNDNFIPGKWSSFAGPDGSENTWFILNDSLPKFTDSQKWMRFKVRLLAAEHSTPVLSSISFGKSVNNKWEGYADYSAPLFQRISKSPTENAHAPFIFTLKDYNPINWNKFKLILNGKDVTDKVTRSENTMTLAPEGGTFPAGVNHCNIQVEDSLGNVLNEECVFYIGKMRTSNIVTLRDDGMTLIDGKPFFPLGMACAVKCAHNNNDYDKLFQLFQDAGMNFARHYSNLNASSKDVNEYLDAAARHGVKIYMAAGRNGANDLDIRRIAENTAKQINLANVALDLGDDTANHITPEQMRMRYNAVKAVDPYKPTTQADPIGSPLSTRYKPFALYTDNFSPEIYPTHDYTEVDLNNTVPTVITTMNAIHNDWKAVGNPLRSCWPLIQYFYNTGNWKRLSDRVELRAMSYQAVIHGAQGIIWYRYAGYGENNKTGFTPEQWEVVASLSREMRQLYDVLCQRAIPQKSAPVVLSGPQVDPQNNPSVSSMLKAHNDKQYLFTASSVRKNLTVKFQVPGAKSVTDFFGKNKLAITQDGEFTENFSPLDVHVYVIE